MKYYANYNAQGVLIGVSKSGSSLDGVTEISKEEYESLLAEIKEKASWVTKICDGFASIDQVPSEWRVEIAERVQEYQSTMSEAASN